MDKITVIYVPEKRRLTFFRNGKLQGGLSGKIAEDRFYAISKEVEQSDILKSISHGVKAKTKEV